MAMAFPFALLSTLFIVGGVVAASSSNVNSPGWNTGTTGRVIIGIVVFFVVFVTLVICRRAFYSHRRRLPRAPINAPPRGRNFRARPPFSQPPPLQPIPPIPFPVPSIPLRNSSPSTVSYAPPTQPPPLSRTSSPRAFLMSPLQAPEASTPQRGLSTRTTSSYLTAPQQAARPPVTSFSSLPVESDPDVSSLGEASTAEPTSSLREEMTSHQKQLISERARIRNRSSVDESDPPPQYSE